MTRGSRRNHDSCRRTNRLVARTVCARRLRRAVLPVEEPQHLGITQRPAGRPALAQPGPRPGGGPPRPARWRTSAPVRSAIRASSSARSTRQPDLHRRVHRLVPRHRRAERPAGQLDDLERAHDAAPVGRQDRGGGHRVERRPAARAAAAGPRLAPAPPPAGRAAPGRCRGTPAGPAPRARTARSRRPASAPGRGAGSSAIASRARRWYSATLAVCRTSQMSSRWCGTPWRCADGELRGADVHARRTAASSRRSRPRRRAACASRERQVGLPGRGRPDDGDHWLRHDVSPSRAPPTRRPGR